uniref:Uncharacterized protein n=1 Tax=Parastrongyloides trichosuri TaxID=131310 RepID=A0A0N4ZNY1_PARTI
MPKIQYFINITVTRFLFLLRLTVAAGLIYGVSNIIFTIDNILKIYEIEKYLINVFPNSILTKDFDKLKKLYQCWPASSPFYLAPVYPFLVQHIIK